MMPVISIARKQLLNESTGKWRTCAKYEVVKYESHNGRVSERSLGFFSNLAEAKEAARIARETLCPRKP